MTVFKVGDIVRVHPDILAEGRQEAWWNERGEGMVHCITKSGDVHVTFDGGKYTWCYESTDLVPANKRCSNCK